MFHLFYGREEPGVNRLARRVPLLPVGPAVLVGSMTVVYVAYQVFKSRRLCFSISGPSGRDMLKHNLREWNARNNPGGYRHEKRPLRCGIFASD